MRPSIAKNRNIIAAAIVGTAIVAAPSAVSAAIAGTYVASGTGTASCPYGYRVTGGGPSNISSNYYGSSSSDEYSVSLSYPSTATAWTVRGTRVHGSYSSSSGWHYYSSSYSPSVKAICVK